jgi:hypothetical protein
MKKDDETPFLKGHKDDDIKLLKIENEKGDDIFNDNFYENTMFYPQRKTMNPKLSKIQYKNNSLFDIFDSRKTYNQPILQKKEKSFKKRITEFLLKTNKKEKIENEFFYEQSEESDEDDYDDNGEDDLYHTEKRVKSQKFKRFVKNSIEIKRSKEWKEYMDVYEKRVKESQTLLYKLKTIFHINSDFIVIWKTTLRIFHIFILFIFFFKYIFLTLAKDDSSLIIPKRILLIYYMINAMFIIDLVFSVLILIFNGGSTLTYFKLPLKIYSCIPFALKKENFYYILPKFIRIDIFQKIFSSWENYINLKVELYVREYILKIFIKCIIQIIKYLLIFGLYAHINCCILSYFDDLNYPSSLFYTIEAFTVIGFGEQSPKNIKSVTLVILNLFVGVNLFSLMSSNIKDLSDKMYSFNRDTSIFDNFEMSIFQMQKSIGRILPSKTKKLMISFLLFRRGLSFHDLKEEYGNIFDVCKNSLIDDIHKQLFEFLKLEYQNIFFKSGDYEFMYEIFENLKPKIFKANQIIIKYGEKVNKLYFLLNGQIFATDHNKNPIFTMIDNSIFGEYEFITKTLSLFNIIVSPKKPAYGFTLDRNTWEKIIKKHVYSANNFIKKIIIKRKKHMEWLNSKRKHVFEKMPTIKEEKFDDEKNEINNINDVSIDSKRENKKFINIEKNKIKKKKNSISVPLETNILENNHKYKYSNINIIRNIDELHREINKIEFNFIDNKNLILKNLKNEYL